MLIHLLLIMN